MLSYAQKQPFLPSMLVVNLFVRWWCDCYTYLLGYYAWLGTGAHAPVLSSSSSSSSSPSDDQIITLSLRKKELRTLKNSSRRQICPRRSLRTYVCVYDTTLKKSTCLWWYPIIYLVGITGINNIIIARPLETFSKYITTSYYVVSASPKEYDNLIVVGDPRPY